MEWLFNPWVICVIIVAVVASNILALKYTAYMRIGLKKRRQQQPPRDESLPSKSADNNHTLDKNNSQDKND
ncbi:DUF2897 domain-containing protein [Photobacterium phosphoreum]|uniref:DUF2897 family protein n=1 Tax=Photobacterium phosphoreum TaxID=659 RepID=UPI000D16DB5E|nr:DUF2897 family protein [Photobacterium phosphoreum]PSU79365.1 DUF2897 domain-containing protein [Photobacterium phosphoreum]